MPPVTLAMLPADLLDTICGFVGEEGPYSFGQTAAKSRRRTFLSLCLTSRGLLPIARRHLYSQPLDGVKPDWQNATALLASLQAGQLGMLVRSLAELPSWLASLANLEAGSNLPFQKPGQTKEYSWLLATVEACPKLREIGVAFRSVTQANKLLRALTPSFPTLQSVIFRGLASHAMSGELLHKFAAKLGVEGLDKVEVVSLNSANPSKQPSLPYRVRSLVLSLYGLAFSTSQQFLPSSQAASLRSLSVNCDTYSPSALLELVELVGATLTTLRVFPALPFYSHSYEYYGQQHSGPVVPAALFSLLPHLRHLELPSSSAALSVDRMRTLSRSSPELVSLVCHDSVWISDTPGATRDSTAWQAALFPQAELANIFTSFPKLKEVDLGLVPLQPSHSIAALEDPLVSKGVDVEYEFCRSSKRKACSRLALELLPSAVFSCSGAFSEMLGGLDLTSTLAGYVSMGCSFWSAIPQIFLLWHSKSRTAGPSFWLLTAWLLGDAGQVSGMFITHALLTQKISGIWFGVSDIIIMAQLLFYRGWIPCTRYFPPDFVVRGRRIDTRDQVAEEEEDYEGGFEESPALRKKPWKDFNGWRLNLVALAVIFVVCVIVWGVVDVLPRETKPELEPIEPPTVEGWLGWGLGMAGLVFYQAPRVWQIYCIHKERTMEAISVWLFIFLILQNVTMLVSIFTVAHTRDALFGQAPFIANTILALIFDGMVVRLHAQYGMHPSKLPDPNHPPREVVPPSQSSVAHHSHRFSLSSASSSALPSRTTSAASARHPFRHNDDDRRALEEQYTRSLREEKHRLRPGPGSWRVPATHEELDHYVSDEGETLNRIRQRIEDSDEGDSEKAGELKKHHAWEERNAKQRGELMTARKARRAWTRRSSTPSAARHPLPPSSSSSSAASSDEGADSSADEPERRPLRLQEQREVGKRAYYPRRGVGTRG
ncbi:hypothetical protein JCM10213v2_005826 [Rhodosporidiobolus nylandii]